MEISQQISGLKSVKLGNLFTYFWNTLNHCFLFLILGVTSIGNALFFIHQDNQVFRWQFLLGFFEQTEVFLLTFALILRFLYKPAPKMDHSCHATQSIICRSRFVATCNFYIQPFIELCSLPTEFFWSTECIDFEVLFLKLISEEWKHTTTVRNSALVVKKQGYKSPLQTLIS